MLVAALHTFIHVWPENVRRLGLRSKPGIDSRILKQFLKSGPAYSGSVCIGVFEN
jgi:hypothetical protein